MRDVFNCIALTVSKVIHGIDAPLVAGAMVVGMFDSVNDRITHVHILMRHVDLRPKNLLSVAISSFFHFLKKRAVLLNGSGAIRTIFSRLRRCTFQRSDLLCSTVIYICQSFADEIQRKLI